MKKYFWIAALIAALAFVMAGCNVGVVGEGGGGEGGGEGETITIDLPLEFTVVNNATQKGWCTNGVDDLVTTLKMADLKNARYLVLELATAPSGGMQFIWQGDGNSWGWDQQDGILNDDGTANAAKGAKFRGESRAADNTVLEIELSKATKNYNSLKASAQAKILIAYYSPDIAGLGITKAYLEIIKGGAPPPPATVTSVTVTPATPSVQPGGTKQFTAAVEGENNPKNTVRWTISGQTKPGTTISAAGLLTIAADEPVDTEITVTATSTVDKTKSGTAKATVSNAPPPLPAGFFGLGEPGGTGTKGWGVIGSDLAPVTGLTWEIFKDTKYLILKAVLKHNDGIGGVQIAIQGDGDGWGWNTSSTGDWTNKPGGAANGDTIYIIYDLTSTSFWTGIIGGSTGKIILNSISDTCEIEEGYLASVTLTQPAGGVDFTDGWVSKTVPPLVP